MGVAFFLPVDVMLAGTLLGEVGWLDVGLGTDPSVSTPFFSAGRDTPSFSAGRGDTYRYELWRRKQRLSSPLLAHQPYLTSSMIVWYPRLLVLP